MVTFEAGLPDIPIAYGGRAASVGAPSDIVTATVLFANRDVVPDPETRLLDLQTLDDHGVERTLFMIEDADGNTRRDGEGVPELVDRRIALAAAREAVTCEQAFAAEMLDAASNSPTALRRWLKREVNAGRKMGVLANPAILLDGQTTKLNWVLTGPSSAKGWIMFAAAQIIVRVSRTVTVVGRCRLQECRRFFEIVRKGPGKPQKLYCSREHMLEQHRLNSGERTRRARAKKKALAAMPRRRRHT